MQSIHFICFGDILKMTKFPVVPINIYFYVKPSILEKICTNFFTFGNLFILLKICPNVMIYFFFIDSCNLSFKAV